MHENRFNSVLSVQQNKLHTDVMMFLLKDFKYLLQNDFSINFKEKNNKNNENNIVYLTKRNRTKQILNDN